MKFLKYYIMSTSLLFFISFKAESRIRLRKVKEAPRVCAFMGDDKLLSRSDKKVLSTERHSLIFDENIMLIKDKGEKICSWRPSEFDTIAPLNQFSFYIDEIKEVIYPHVKLADVREEGRNGVEACELEGYSQAVVFL